VRKFLGRHSDGIFILLMVGAFTVIGGVLLHQRYLSMQGWQTDFQERNVTLGELTVWQDRDTTPPLDAPIYAAIKSVNWLHDDDSVIALEMNGEWRAYPLAMLVNHQIVNDIMQGIPIAVTYCPLCNSAVVFNRRVGDHVLRFGVSGATRNNGFLMWDDYTQSWWQQFTGEAIMGAYMGTRLEVLPSKIVTWSAYTKWHTMGRVLVADKNQGQLAYSPEKIAWFGSIDPAPYIDKPLDKRLPPKERVLATILEGSAVAYPFSLLTASGVINDVIGDQAVAAFWQSAHLEKDNAIEPSQDTGMAVLFYRVVNGQTLTFVQQADTIIDTETGSTWTIFGEAVKGPLKNTRLEQVSGSAYYWFAWINSYPETRLYSAPQ